MAQMGNEGLSKSQAAVLKAMRENPLYKIEEIAALVGLGKARVSQVIAELKSLGRLERVGGKKGGYWRVK